MKKLSPTQHEILTRAASRATLSIEPLPKNVNKGIAPTVIASLLKHDFVEPFENGYRIAPKGCEAIGITPTKKQRKPTKKTLIVGMLNANDGATIETLCDATGWQQHSVRGAISTLKQKGHTIISSKNSDGKRRYAIESIGVTQEERALL